MIVEYIRSSSYSNWEYCELQYFITYNLGYQSPSGKKAQLGTMVHKVMECLASCTKDVQEQEMTRRPWAPRSITDDALGEVSFTETKLKTKKFVKELLDRSFEWYSSNDHHSYTPADVKFCQKQIDEALSFNDGQFDPRKRRIVDTEPQFDIPIDEDWAKFTDEDGTEKQLAIKGTIDLVTEIDSDTIEVVDWKTGQRKNWATGEKKTYEKLLEDPQLLLYNYAISKLYPQYKQAIMSIFFTRDGGPFSMCFDESDQKLFLSMLEKRYKDISKTKFPRPCSKNRSSFKCTRLCHFYKTNWPGTDKTMCNHVEDRLYDIGHDATVKECTKKGHSVGYYEAPG